MVKIAQRMSVLRPLLSLRQGPGAAILPQYLPKSEPSSNSSSSSSSSLSTEPQPPTLLRVRLTFPPGIGPASKGARGFWRNHLRRLKYHNPALPIIVDQNAQQGTLGNPGPPWRLALDFEGDEKALRELATEPKNERFKELMEQELKPRPRRSDAGNENESSTVKGEGSQGTQSAPASSSSNHPPNQQTSPSSSSPSSASSLQTPPLISTRTVSLPVLNRPANALWFWFQQRTKCIDVPQPESDRQLTAELAEREVKADADRERVKKVVARIRAKDEMMASAKREAAKIQVE